MISIKLNKDIRLQKYLNKGIKIFINYGKDKSKWFVIKLDNNKTELLQFIINILSNSE